MSRRRVLVSVGCAALIAAGVYLVAGYEEIARSLRARAGRDDRGAAEIDRPVAPTLAEWPVPASATDAGLLQEVYFEFVDAGGRRHMPIAVLSDVSGSEFALLPDKETVQYAVRTGLIPGGYRLTAISPGAGREELHELTIDHEGVYSVPYEQVTRRLRVNLYRPTGGKLSAPVLYRLSQRPRFSAVSVRRKDKIIDLVDGDDVQSDLPPAGAWARADGPTFAIEYEPRATVRLEVAADESRLAASTWIPSFFPDSELDLVLGYRAPSSSIEIRLGGRNPCGRKPSFIPGKIRGGAGDTRTGDRP